MATKLEIFSDLSERIDYNRLDFPLYAQKSSLRQFDRYSAVCHWHPDLEFIFVLDGAMTYFVNGQTICIDTNDGIFVNSKRLHYGYSNNQFDCEFLVAAVHPALLGEGTPAGKAFIESKFGSYTEDFILLRADNPWQRNVLTGIQALYEEVQIDGQNILRLLSLASSLCASTAEHIQLVSKHNGDEYVWTIIWNMTGFIHQHYGLEITLEDIAAAGSICRSKCCKLFSQYIGQSPNTYLVQYRVHKSCGMLKDTNMSVSEISMACGFQSPSYFTQVFRQETGYTPRDYRKMK